MTGCTFSPAIWTSTPTSTCCLEPSEWILAFCRACEHTPDHWSSFVLSIVLSIDASDSSCWGENAVSSSAWWELCVFHKSKVKWRSVSVPPDLSSPYAWAEKHHFIWWERWGRLQNMHLFKVTCSDQMEVLMTSKAPIPYWHLKRWGQVMRSSPHLRSTQSVQYFFLGSSKCKALRNQLRIYLLLIALPSRFPD